LFERKITNNKQKRQKINKQHTSGSASRGESPTTKTKFL
jgi:hypothetical protein